MHGEPAQGPRVLLVRRYLPETIDWKSFQPLVARADRSEDSIFPVWQRLEFEHEQNRFHPVMWLVQPPPRGLIKQVGRKPLCKNRNSRLLRKNVGEEIPAQFLLH